jgi:hypothetical protein
MALFLRYFLVQNTALRKPLSLDIITNRGKRKNIKTAKKLPTHNVTLLSAILPAFSRRPFARTAPMMQNFF